MGLNKLFKNNNLFKITFKYFIKILFTPLYDSFWEFQKVYPPSSKLHTFIIVTTDYFTKWVKAKAYRNVDQSKVIKFIKEIIIYRFSIPESITTDIEIVFISQYVKEFAHDYGIQFLHSTPYYAQANGQAKASNKIIKDLIRKTIEGNPRTW